jgi:AraC family transcriptional regulator of adaptative response/methylated-DNA-[protein]-cysteine methyltransferase
MQTAPIQLNYANFDALWDAFHDGTSAHNGQLYMGVRTTGIYCRPGCPARQPKRENVRFFATPGAAERVGFRACKRCHPQDVAADPRLLVVEQACRYIDDHYDEDITLGGLADALAIGQQTLQRAFRDVVGLSPRVYTRERRLAQFRDELRDGSDVSRALYGAGFSSPSRVYEHAERDLGMTPARYRNGADDLTIAVSVGLSPFGAIAVGRTDVGICAVRLGDTPDDVVASVRSEFPAATMTLGGQDRDLQRIIDHVVSGTSIADLALDIRGTAFQRKVWDELRRIPRGERRSYADIAREIGNPAAVRAVANACATNPVAVAVPCHRVVRSDGGEGGYRWGADRKHTILELEQVG